MKKWQNNVILVLLIVLISIGFSLSNIRQSYAQRTHSEGSDITPIIAYIIITKNSQGKEVFEPQNTTIKQGEEIMILNNLTKAYTFTNGKGTGDPMDGKLFSVDISPHSFAEYLSSNLSPGDYPFYSKNNPIMTGHLIIQPK